MNHIELLVSALVILSLLGGIYFILIEGVNTFENTYVVEDGLVEYGTVLFLLLTGLFNFYKLIKYRSNHGILWMLGAVLFGLLFVFGAGEEISWGQRILGFETPEALKDINRQDELTLHNIRIGDFDVNRLIFSQLLTAILVIYFIIYPIVYKRMSMIKRLTILFGVPIPQLHHTILFLLATIVALILPSDKKWELHEFAFAAVFFLIFLFPDNRKEIH